MILKVGHVTQATPLLTYFCIFWFVGLAVNPRTKFDVSNFTHFRDTVGSKNFKSRSRDVGYEPFDLLLLILACRPGAQSAHQISRL